MAEFIVNDERTAQVAASTLNMYDTAIVQLQTIKQELDNLTEDGYRTPASKRDFQPFVQTYNDNYLQVIEGLAGISKFLDGVGKGFAQLDTDLGASLTG
ncbi:hypothetical protein [Streptomyces sp. NPDC001985]|uniref:hypothetical protein n=1 Tax=Streptomyces sp. NPDC001985 TaxID=3154406 RepID=UPI003323F633